LIKSDFSGSTNKESDGSRSIQAMSQVKKKLWGGEFWTDGYFASPVGKHGNEKTIGNYV